MLVLYYAPNTCALASHIALEDAGAEYRLRRIDFDKEEQRGPDYLAINPKGRVRWSHFVGQFGSAVKVYSVV